jgi:hypothetical protein
MLKFSAYLSNLEDSPIRAFYAAKEVDHFPTECDKLRNCFYHHGIVPIKTEMAWYNHLFIETGAILQSAEIKEHRASTLIKQFPYR